MELPTLKKSFCSIIDILKATYPLVYKKLTAKNQNGLQQPIKQGDSNELNFFEPSLNIFQKQNGTIFEKIKQVFMNNEYFNILSNLFNIILANTPLFSESKLSPQYLARIFKVWQSNLKNRKESKEQLQSSLGFIIKLISLIYNSPELFPKFHQPHFNNDHIHQNESNQRDEYFDQKNRQMSTEESPLNLVNCEEFNQFYSQVQKDMQKIKRMPLVPQNMQSQHVFIKKTVFVAHLPMQQQPIFHPNHPPNKAAKQFEPNYKYRLSTDD